ncbi:MAG: GNAT family N-acetyltransferase [Armatimonadetes bacterium]|nr:GNAT family N-acetyltransferase [Armatimonadota bacterium]
MPSDWTRYTLVAPDARLEAEYVSFAEDVERAGDAPSVALFRRLGFKAYLEKRASDERGEALDNGTVPQSTYWMRDPDGRICGELRLRHGLNDRLLQEGGHIGYFVRPSHRRQGVGTELLRRGRSLAQARGIDRVLVTCDDDNVGSIGVIRSNGGTDWSSGVSPRSGKPVRLYWLTTEGADDRA